MTASAARWEHKLAGGMAAQLGEMLCWDGLWAASARPARFCPVSPRVMRMEAERLRAAVAHKIGLVQVSVPQRPQPLWLRAGTADVDEAIAALGCRLGEVHFLHRPRRILEFGAGAGYRTVGLAMAHPDAHILAVEPDPAFDRVGLLNTLAYPNVTYVNAAGPLDGLLRAKHFAGFDTLIMSGASLPCRLPPAVRLIALKDADAALTEPFAGAEFLTRSEGAYTLIYRRAPLPLPARWPVPVFAAGGAARSVTPSSPDDFAVLGADTFALRATSIEAAPARVTLTAGAPGAQLRLRLHADGAPVDFSIGVETADGRALGSTRGVIAATEIRAIGIPLAPHDGACAVYLTAQLTAPGVAWLACHGPVFI